MYQPLMQPVHFDGAHFPNPHQQQQNGYGPPHPSQQVVAKSPANRKKRYNNNQLQMHMNDPRQQQQQQMIITQHHGHASGEYVKSEMLPNGGGVPDGVYPVNEMCAENCALDEKVPEVQIKTPVSVLQEVLSKRGITPSYELVQIEGAIHEPTFRYRVSFNDKDAMGAGKSKKEAKHAAAKALIEKLSEISLYPPQVAKQNATCASSSSNHEIDPKKSTSSEDQVAGNPIGWLQEQCMIRRWPPPTYETEMEVGLPHQREFTIACIVLKHYEVGQGKSKKIAKRQAAHKMWLMLQQYPVEGSGAGPVDGSGNDEENRVTNRYGDLKDAHIPTLTNQHSYKVSQFHKTIKANCGRNLAALQSTCLNMDHINFVQFLHAIAAEHQFEVTYVDIEEKTYSGRQQCLVQLSTLPVAVCHGSGDSSNEAQASAARNALEYLKIMTKM